MRPSQHMQVLESRGVSGAAAGAHPQAICCLAA